MIRRPAAVAVATYARGSVRDQLTSEARNSGRIFQLLLLLSLGISLGVLVILFYDVFVDGVGVFSNRAQASSRGASDPRRMLRACSRPSGAPSGSACSSAVLAFPIGVASAVYLEEYATKGRFARMIDVCIRNLAGVPSIVYGILGLALFVQAMDRFTGGRTLMAAGITLSILVLPIVIITSAEAMRAVPALSAGGGLRRGGHPVRGDPVPCAPVRPAGHHHRHGPRAGPGHRRGGPALRHRRGHRPAPGQGGPRSTRARSRSGSRRSPW